MVICSGTGWGKLAVIEAWCRTGGLSVMSRISPLKYGTDGTENRPGDMDKGLWRRQSGINGRQKITAVLQLPVIQILEEEACSS